MMCEDSIGVRIKKYRKLSGRTQKQLADDLEVTNVAVQRYECGSREPRIKTLCKIASVLGCEVVDLIPTEWVVFHDL